MARIYVACAGLLVGGLRWSSFFIPLAFVDMVLYLRKPMLSSYNRVQFSLKNLSELLQLANPKHFGEQQAL